MDSSFILHVTMKNATQFTKGITTSGRTGLPTGETIMIINYQGTTANASREQQIPLQKAITVSVSFWRWKHEGEEVRWHILM